MCIALYSFGEIRHTVLISQELIFKHGVQVCKQKMWLFNRFWPEREHASKVYKEQHHSLYCDMTFDLSNMMQHLDYQIRK